MFQQDLQLRNPKMHILIVEGHILVTLHITMATVPFLPRIAHISGLTIIIRFVIDNLALGVASTFSPSNATAL